MTGLNWWKLHAYINITADVPTTNTKAA